MKFKCYDCGNIFEAEERRKDYTDAIYGPCSKWVAECEKCGGEAIEYVVNHGKSKPRSEGAPCGNYESCRCCGG